MARYLSRPPYGGQKKRTRNKIYIVSALLIIAAAIAFIYGAHPFGKSKDADYVPPADANTATETTPPVVGPMKPEPEPEPEPDPEPVHDPINVAPEPTAESNPHVTELIAEVMALINEDPGKIIEARDRLNEALSMPMSQQQRGFVKGRLSRFADKWLFSRSIFPEDRLCDSYKVKPGDRLRAIGRKFKVPYETLMQLNNIARPEVLQAAETIKVIKGPFHARIYRSSFTMDLYLQDTFIRSFPVGLGQPGKETPTGLWQVKSDGKMVEPPWPDPVTGKILHPGDPDYALGSRWIGLEGLKGNAKGRTGFGIHGTKDPETIGTQSSRGCIRLHNGDVIRIYNVLVPIHSLVEVKE